MPPKGGRFRTNGLAVFLAQPKNQRFAGLGCVRAHVRKANGMTICYAGSSNGQAVGPRNHLAMVNPAPWADEQPRLSLYPERRLPPKHSGWILGRLVGCIPSVL